MYKGIQILLDENVDYLNDILLDENGRYKSIPFGIMNKIPLTHLHLWAHHNAIYQFVTDEMTEWLKAEIGGEYAIEIGAGNGVISRSLGIIGTDSYIQVDDKAVRAYYDMLKVAVTRPPAQIQKYEAYEAVRALKPHTVVGAFITQFGTGADYRQGINCSPYGVKEWMMLPFIKKYILFGNKITHNGKHIFELPHRELQFAWLVSRANDQSLNRVWIWENH